MKKEKTGTTNFPVLQQSHFFDIDANVDIDMTPHGPRPAVTSMGGAVCRPVALFSRCFHQYKYINIPTYNQVPRGRALVPAGSSLPGPGGPSWALEKWKYNKKTSKAKIPEIMIKSQKSRNGQKLEVIGLWSHQIEALDLEIDFLGFKYIPKSKK